MLCQWKLFGESGIQGSVLNNLLFSTMMEEVTKEARSCLPWELMYADDLVLMVTRDELRRKLVEWRTNILVRRLKVNAGKTKLIVGGGLKCQGLAQNNVEYAARV